MPRKPRLDAPGMFHHVMNRGVERRPVFEREDDYRYFKVLLACAVRASRIRVHGYSLMLNHYHLLVESCDGQIGETLRRIQALYAGRFNRTRSVPRPGHLFGARFKSFPIQDYAYLFTVVSYIDLNPVKAGLCRNVWEYPHGSAGALLSEGRSPPWVCGKTMDRILAPLRSQGMGLRSAYSALFAGCRALKAMDVVEACLEASASTAHLELDALLGGNHAYRRRWLERRALEGERAGPSAPIVHADSIIHVINEERALAPTKPLGPRSSLGIWDVLAVGLLRDLGGSSLRSMCTVLGISKSTVAKRYQKHQEGMRDVGYANVAALVAKAVLVHCYGAHARSVAAQASHRPMSQEVDESS